MTEIDLKQRFNKAMKLRMVSKSFGLKGEELGKY
ncbi:hypothetical protein BDW_07035 [Bdellovibrio bacteriovorus W]|nr:hypothetical protein BDW_07035 [Bdellovibrio bacteriovorus W]